MNIGKLSVVKLRSQCQFLAKKCLSIHPLSGIVLSIVFGYEIFFAENNVNLFLQLQFESSILDPYTYPESRETNRMLCIQCASRYMSILSAAQNIHSNNFLACCSLLHKCICLKFQPLFQWCSCTHYSDYDCVQEDADQVRYFILSIRTQIGILSEIITTHLK